MQKRLRIAAGFAAAALLLGGTGAVAVANASSGPIPEGPALIEGPSNGPDIPGVPDTPEPGDTPDAPPPPPAP